MKIFFIGICCAFITGAYAQTVTTKSYPLQPGQQVSLKFDFPVVKISTWEKNEVSVTARVSINEGENDNAFILEDQTTEGTLIVSDRIKGLDELPRRYTIVRNGKKTVFRSKADYLEASKGGGIQQSYEGSADMDIVVEVKIPARVVTDVKAIYGIVEVTGFNAPVTIDATYGGIDATISTAHTGELQATTHYGQIYSNLELNITDHTEHDFFNSITATPGNGPTYKFTSAYGKIYLRKP